MQRVVRIGSSLLQVQEDVTPQSRPQVYTEGLTERAGSWEECEVLPEGQVTRARGGDWPLGLATWRSLAGHTARSVRGCWGDKARDGSVLLRPAALCWPSRHQQVEQSCCSVAASSPSASWLNSDPAAALHLTCRRRKLFHTRTLCR